MKIFLDANICLDLLDTTRTTSKRSVKWYLENKDDQDKELLQLNKYLNMKIIQP